MGSFRRSLLFFIAPFAVAVGGASAEEHDEHDHRAHDAHVHGTWELFAALDDSQLSITIKGPLIDVVGFEHAPATEDEHNAIQQMRSRLAAPELMLSLTERATCTLSEPVQINLPQGFPQVDMHEGENHEQEPDKEADHHGHDEHEDEAHHADHDVHTNDLEVTYAFDCQSPARLRAITMTGFDAFPAIENVDAVFLGDAKQVARRLGRGTQTLAIED